MKCTIKNDTQEDCSNVRPGLAEKGEHRMQNHVPITAV